MVIGKEERKREDRRITREIISYREREIRSMKVTK